MKKINQLKAGAVLSYASLLIGNIISILYTPLVLRLLGQSEYGLFNLSNSIVGYLGILNLGFGSAIVRYTAKYRAINDKEGEYNLNGMFIVVYSLLALIVIIAGSFLVMNADNIFGKSLLSEELIKIKILMMIMIFNLAISFPFGIFASIITAYERFVFPKIIGIIRTILSPFVMLPLLLMGYKSITMTLVTTIINVLFIGINMYYCFKVLKIKVKFNNLDFIVFKEIFGYSFFILLNTIVDKIYWSTDQFILGAVSGTVAVAIYSVGSNFNNYYMAFSTAVTSVFLPKVTKMVFINVPDKELSDLFIKTGRIQYIIMSLILGGFIIVGKEFIGVWAGLGYEEAYYIAIIVMIPLTIPLIQTLGITILQAKNMHKFRSNVYLIIALVNLTFSIPMARAFGGIGAALCTSIAMIIGHIVIMNIYYYKKIKIDIPSFWRNIIKMSFPAILSLIIGLFFENIIVLKGIYSVLINGLVFLIVFIVLMWNMGMNEYEKKLISIPINNIFTKVVKKIKKVRP
ncbi:oligosaccharide flippase family protein [Clostridium celatum]|uniref:oligosaccharide flippase family protein n=1 Tax=Clostridium celatum TaxID=36834 RepID=UPI00189AC3BB|nr:oligosaccharide flippase family protein [Clostridium celatum]